MSNVRVLNKYEQKITYETYIQLRHYLHTLSQNERERAVYQRVNTLPLKGGIFEENVTFEIKVYDYHDIVLEKKTVHHGIYHIETAPLTKGECIGLLKGDIGWMLYDEDPLIQELYRHMADYDTEPEDIRSGIVETFQYDNAKISLERMGIRTADYHYLLDQSKNAITFIGGDITVNILDERCMPDFAGDRITSRLLEKGTDIRLRLWE